MNSKTFKIVKQSEKKHVYSSEYWELKSIIDLKFLPFQKDKFKKKKVISLDPIPEHLGKFHQAYLVRCTRFVFFPTTVGYENFVKLRSELKRLQFMRICKPRERHLIKDFLPFRDILDFVHVERDYIIFKDNTKIHTKDYPALFNYIKENKPSLISTKQNGSGTFIAQMVEKYSKQLQSALVAAKLMKVNSALAISQLSLGVLQLIICIINMCIYGNAIGKVASLIVAIGQVLVGISSVIVDNIIQERSGELMQTIAELTQEYLGKQGTTVKQFSMPSIEIMISAVCGIIGVGIAGATMFKCKWADNFSKNMINGDKFRKALRSTVGDTRSFVEEVAETCFKVNISPLAQTFEKVKQVSEEVTNWLQKPDSYMVSHPRELAKFSKCLAQANEIYASYKVKTGALESRYANALNLLFQNIICAKGRLDHLRRLRMGDKVKQEPPCFMFVGRPGAGKTTLVNTYVIPEIQKALGWSPDKYVIDFGGQPEFWPPYLGEEAAFFDEFLAMKSKDPVVPHLNRICSTEHNIIPGANTYTKEQECLFKVLLLGSNVHYQSFADVLNKEAEDAMWSRITRIEVVNKTCPPEDTYDRSRITHTPEFTELEFRRFLKPPTSHSKNAKEVTKHGTNTRGLNDPYIIISKEEVVKIITEAIMQKHKEFLKFSKTNTEDEIDSLGYYVPTNIKALEGRQQLVNILNPVTHEPPKVKERIVMARMGDEDYTAETLEYYLDRMFKSITTLDAAATPLAIDTFITKLENIITSDKIVLKSLFKKVVPQFEAMSENTNFSQENRIRLIRLFAKHGVLLAIGKPLAFKYKASDNKDVVNKFHTRVSMGSRQQEVYKKPAPAMITVPLNNTILEEEEEVEEQPIPVPQVVEEVVQAQPEVVEREIETQEPWVQDVIEASVDPNIPLENVLEVLDEEEQEEGEITEVEFFVGEYDEIKQLADAMVDIPINNVEKSFKNFAHALQKVTEDYEDIIEAYESCEEKPEDHIIEQQDLFIRMNKIASQLYSLIPEDQIPHYNKMFDSYVERIHPDLLTYYWPKMLMDKLQITVQESGGNEHLVYYIYGPPGTGKSTMAESVAEKMSQAFRLPLVSVKLDRLENVIVHNKSVIVLHDKVADQQQYSSWYDTLPNGCVILNTNNFNLQKVSGLRAYTSRIKSYYIIEEGNIPGYARRSGVPGYVYHAKQWAFTNPEIRGVINVPTFGKYYLNGELSTINTIFETISGAFLKLNVNNGTVSIERKESFETEFKGDLTFKIDSIARLKTLVTSAKEMFNAYVMPNEQRAIQISQNLKKTDFIFSPSDFVLPKCNNEEEIREMALKSYTLLRQGGRDFTAHIVTPEIEIRCYEGKVEYCTESEMEVYSWHVTKYNGIPHIQLINLVDDTPVAMYSASTIVAGYVYGFQATIPNTPEFKHMQFLLKQKDNISQHPEIQPLIIASKPHEINVAVVEKKYAAYTLLWESFTQSRMYKVLLTVGIILTSMVVLLTLWGIGKFVIDMFSKKDDKQQCPDFIIVDGKKYGIHPNVSGNTVHYEVTPPEGVDVDVDQITPILDTITALNFGEKYNTGNIMGVVKQYGSNPAVGRKPKAPVVASKRIISSKQSMIDNAGHSAVREKLTLAQCVVEYGQLRMFGLRWKGREVLFPAHLVTNRERIVNVTLPVHLGSNNYAMMVVPARVHHLDIGNDIAVATILSDDVPLAKDLTKYFHREKDMKSIRDALLMKRMGGCSPMTYYSKGVEYFNGACSIVRQNGKSVTDHPNTALEFYLASFKKIPTQAGDCGSLYVSLDNTCNTAMIIGMHTNSDINHRKSWGNVISQEYLASIGKQTYDTVKQSCYKTFSLSLTKEDHPEVEMLSKEWIMEDVYYDTFSELEPTIESDIFYDAENNPDSNLLFLGKERKFKPSWIGKPSHQKTPWHEQLAEEHKTFAPLVTPQGHISLTDPRKHPDPDSLKILDGKPSIIATQIDMYSDPIPWTDKMSELLEKAMPIYSARLDADYGRKFRLLTDLEVINGLFFEKDDFYGHLDAMDLTTSTGDYPKRFFNKTVKKELFEKIDHPLERDIYYWKDDDVSQQIKASCGLMEQSAMNGVRMCYPATDSLKYELQGKPNKSRCFQCLSIQEVMLLRRYTGTLQSVVAREHLSATCSVGIDPVTGFHSLHRRFLEKSLYGEAGDFKRWDKHLLAKLIRRVMKDIATRYAESLDDPTIYLVFDVITDIIIHTLCIADGAWYIKMRGNPSGNVLTSVLNSFINLLMTIMAVIYIVEKHNDFLQTNPTDDELIKRYTSEFRNKVSLMRKKVVVSDWINKHFDVVFYGDDKKSVISADYLWLVNFESFRDFYVNVMGIDYDSPEKDGNYVKYDKLENLSYLSRTSRQHNGVTLPALKVETVNAFLYWARTNDTAQWETLMDVAIAEAVLHDEEYYNQIRKVILWIRDWCKEAGYTINYVPPAYTTKLQETIALITNGRSSGIATAPAIQGRKVRIDDRATPCTIVQSRHIQQIIKRSFSKVLTTESGNSCVRTDVVMGNHQGTQMINTQESTYQDLLEIDQRLRAVFNDWQGSFITGYHPFPALVMSPQGNTVSVCFRANEYALENIRLVQSDVVKYIEHQVGIRLKLATICYRKISEGTVIPIWQLHFIQMPTTAVSRLTATQMVLNNNKKISTTQATGTADMGMIEEHVSENDADAVMPVTQGTARGVLTKAPIWHLNLANTVTQYRECPDSPLVVKVPTAVHSVVDKLSYGDMSTMPTAMRWWSYSHESGAPTIWIEYKFISAATIVNQLIVGIADSNKTTYSMEELQQIEGVVINPQEGTIAVPLKLAATTLTNEAPTRVTLSQTKIDGTDASPVYLPTLVLMTATAIQNAYDNDKVQVNIRKKAKFGPLSEPWFVTSRTLSAMNNILNPTNSRTLSSALSFRSFSELMGLPPAYPVFVTCDGAYAMNHSQTLKIVTINKNLPSLNTLSNVTACSQELLITNDNTNNLTISYGVQMPAIGGSVYTFETQASNTVSGFATRVLSVVGGDTAGGAMRKIFNATGNLFVPSFTVGLFCQGENSIIPGENYITVDGIITEDNVYEKFITPYVESLKDISYTVSEFPQPIPVVIGYDTRQFEVKKRLGYNINIDGFGNADLTAFTTPQQDVGANSLARQPRREFNFTHVIEMVANDRTSVTVYVAVCTSGFINDASAGQVNFRDVDDVTTHLQGFNLGGLQMAITNMRSRAICSAAIRTNFIPRIGTVEEKSLATSSARVIETSMKPDSTLGATMTRLTLSNTLPKTIPTTVAKGQNGVEVRDDYSYAQLRLFIDRAGFIVREDEVLIFELFFKTGITTVATVIYDLTTNEMYIVNNPQLDADRYKTLRKLTAEEVYVGNFRTQQKTTSLIQATDTGNWIDRVVPDASEGVYTGALTTRVKVDSVRKIRMSTNTKESTTQAEALLPVLAAGGQATGSFFQSIMQYFMMKNQLDTQQKQKLEQMEKDFQNKLSLQQNQQQWKEKMAGMGNAMAQSPTANSVLPYSSNFVASSPTNTADGEAPLNQMQSTTATNQADTFDQQIDKYRAMLYKHAGILSGDCEVEHPTSDATALGLPSTSSSQPASTSVPTNDYILSRTYTPTQSAQNQTYGSGNFKLATNTDMSKSNDIPLVKPRIAGYNDIFSPKYKSIIMGSNL